MSLADTLVRRRARLGAVTGTGDTDTFVGRAAGRDLGDAGETGAEARREAERGGTGR
jgi:hypothetical protein